MKENEKAGRGDRRQGRCAPLAVLALLLLLGRSAAAAPDLPAGAPAKPPANPASQEELVLVVGGPEGGDLDPARVEEAIGRELGRRVTRDPSRASPEAARIEVVLRDRDLLVRHRDRRGRTIERAVERPRDDGDLVPRIAWLAGNLARDEAAELLDGLTPPPPPEGEASPAAASPAPEPAAPPAEEPTAEETTAEVPIAEKPTAGKPTAAKASGAEGIDTRPVLVDTPANLALVHPVAIFFDGPERRFYGNLGLLQSRAGAVRGVSIDGLAGWIDHDLQGFHLAGLWSHVGEELAAVRIAGLVASDRAGGGGFTLAGLANVHLGRPEVPRQVGSVIAGLYNLSPDLDGQQIAGVFNDARDVRGLQASGLVNRARHLQGVQIGVLNVAERVEGTQIGLINVAREIDGAAIAPINVVEEGRIQAAAWTSNTEPVNVGAFFVAPPLISVVSVGYAVGLDGEADRLVPQLGLGGRLPLPPVHFDLIAAYAPEMDPAGKREPIHSARYRLSVGWDVLPPLGVFAAGGVRHAVAPGSSIQEVGPELSLGVTVL